MKMIKKMELHTHTKFSRDSLISLPILILMLKIRKIDIIAITDHNEINGAIKYKEKLKKFNIKCIVGEEINTMHGEIIGLFLNQKINPGMSARNTMLEIKKQGGLVYIPHPSDKKRIKTVLKEEEICRNADLIDIVEVFNGRTTDSDDLINSEKICNKYNKLQCIGSDAHVFFELGRNYIEIRDFNNNLEFVENLRGANFKTKNAINKAHLVTKFVKVIKYLMRGDTRGLFRIINKRCRRVIYKFSKKY